MGIQAISGISFKANTVNQAQNTTEENKKVEVAQSAPQQVKDKDDDVKLTGGAGKAAASFFIPGLGQLLDGRKKEGLILLGSGLGLGAANIALGMNYAKQAIENAGSDKTIKKSVLAIPLTVALWAHRIYRTVDAYRGDKNENKAADKAETKTIDKQA